MEKRITSGRSGIKSLKSKKKRENKKISRSSVLRESSSDEEYKKFHHVAKNVSKPSKNQSPKALTPPKEGMRLNRFIARAGICSRREADEYIAQGLVKVNGKVIHQMGYIVNANDDVQFDGRHILPEKPVYILLNKPKDYISATRDDRSRKTVLDLVKGVEASRLFPVGRLDRQSTGLMILTNDGDLADRLMHPRKKVSKLYKIQLDRALKPEDFYIIKFDGVMLEDGLFKPDEIEYVENSGNDTLGILIHSGRNRIIRRMFEALGYKVIKLDRVMLAHLTKKNLPRGKWRYLSPAEIATLKGI